MSCTHSFSTLPVSPAVYAEIEGLLRAAGYGHVFVDGAIDMMGIALVVSDTPPRARGDYIHQLVFARAWNEAIKRAALVVCPFPHVEEERACEEVAASVRELAIPYRPAEDEARFARRDELIDRRHSLTADEQAELQELREWIERLPTAHDGHDQAAMDLIHEAAQLLRKHDLGQTTTRRRGHSRLHGRPLDDDGGIELTVEVTA